MNDVEVSRLAVQATFDSEREQSLRNKLGQFATPTILAREILKTARDLTGEKPICFLDPALGTGSFYSALIEIYGDRVKKAVGIEVDKKVAELAGELWRKYPLEILDEDFTKLKPAPIADLIICNPPYVRHHHMDGGLKEALQFEVRKRFGYEVSGLSGLYCYFMLLSHHWMKDDAIAGWLIPSEFMAVNYGRAIKQYLTEQVELLHIHRFDPANVQFDDALVSSVVVWFRKRKPTKASKVKFTFGGTLSNPKNRQLVLLKTLDARAKWTKYPQGKLKEPDTSGEPVVSDLFSVRRGLATGDNKFFILSDELAQELGLPSECLRPILPSPRRVPGLVIDADKSGKPLLDDRLVLIDSKLSKREIERRFPALHKYLDAAEERKVHEGFLCAHRDPWYSQESREPAPIVCTYMGRSIDKNPFRFIRNRSHAVATNVYLMLYPKPFLQELMTIDPTLIDRIWAGLNEITPASLISGGRVYGGGLHKLEPKELANIPIGDLLKSTGIKITKQRGLLD